MGEEVEPHLAAADGVSSSKCGVVGSQQAGPRPKFGSSEGVKRHPFERTIAIIRSREFKLPSVSTVEAAPLPSDTRRVGFVGQSASRPPQPTVVPACDGSWLQKASGGAGRCAASACASGTATPAVVRRSSSSEHNAVSRVFSAVSTTTCSLATVAQPGTHTHTHTHTHVVSHERECEAALRQLVTLSTASVSVGHSSFLRQSALSATSWDFARYSPFRLAPHSS
jgi:hypothetical protein